MKGCVAAVTWCNKGTSSRTWKGKKKILPAGVAEHWNQCQRYGMSICIENQIDKAQDLNI